MPWIGAKTPQPAKAVTARTAPGAASLEAPTVVRARGLSPANAIVEQVTAHECRLRSVVFFDNGATLDFDVHLPGHAPVSVHGRVASRTKNGPRFVYRVTLDRMTPAQTDELARTVAQAHRGQTRLRSAATIKDLPTTADGLTRKHPRLDTEFSVQYRTPKEGFRPASAANVSTGGMLLTCREALVAGMLIELHFKLPSDVLDVFPEETLVLDLRQPGERRAVPSKLRRPFEDMVLHARVAYYDPLGGGVYNYGLSFCGLERGDREELARYVDAVRHAQLRAGGRPG